MSPFFGDKKTFFLLLFLSTLFFDQISKYIIRNSGGFYICNSGIAFGLPLPQIATNLFFITFLLLFLVALRKKHIFLSLGWILLFSGAFSNFLDRLFFGCVIDFIELGFWPLFNLADTFIFLGFVLLFFQSGSQKLTVKH